MKAIVAGTVFVAAAIVIGWLSLRGRRGAYLGLAGLLGAASVVNTLAAIANPAAYRDLYADRALIPLYRDILHGMTLEQARVVVLFVAACQLGIAVLLALRRLEVLALTGATLFFVGVAPLGPETLLSLVFAASTLILLRRALARQTPVPPPRARHPRGQAVVGRR